MRRGCCFAGLTVLVLATALWGRQGIVYLTDGSQYSGDIQDSETGNMIVVVHSVQVAIPRDQVESVDYPGSPDEEFQFRMARLTPRDTTGRLEVARWASGIKRYDLARLAIADALAIDRTDPAALEAMRIVNIEATLTTRRSPQTQIARSAAPPLQSVTAPSTRAATLASTVPSTLSSTPATAPSNKPYLTDDQINRIRQIELRPDDAARVSFTHDARKTYLSGVLSPAQNFYLLPEADQARQILSRGDPSLAPDVRITTDPSSITEFRLRIRPLVMGGCAISGCHNAVAAQERAAKGDLASFGLFTNDDSPAAHYTNFYMLQTYASAPPAGGAQRLMIDRTFPQKSLLVQFGLPQAVAETPHPPAEGFHPVFLSRNDPHYQSLVHWITYSLRSDGGNYFDIHYRPPWAASQASTSQPTSAPATVNATQNAPSNGARPNPAPPGGPF